MFTDVSFCARNLSCCVGEMHAAWQLLKQTCLL